MLESIDRDLQRVNPVTADTVHRLTRPGARDSLLRELVSEPTARPGSPRTSSGRRLMVAPLLVAAAVAAVVLSAVSLLDDRLTRDAAPVAAPAPPASSCPGVSLPGAAQLVQRRAGSTFCVHVPLAASVDPSGRTAPTAWSALTVGGGSPDLMVTQFVDALPAPPADGVLVLGTTSDAFPDDVVEADGRVLETHRVFGTASRDVTAVEIVLPDGRTLSASLTAGVWGAWWPAGAGGPDDSQVRIRTPEATTTVDLDTVGLPERSRILEGVPGLFRQDDS